MLSARSGSATPVEVVIAPAGDVELSGFLTVPDEARGLIVFVHGSGSSRFSRRNHQVAQFLVSRGLGTLLMDLLTPQEEQIDAVTRELRFDIPLLAGRVVGTLDWVARQSSTAPLAVGLFGSSTGAAAALIAAAERPDQVAAVVSRGGRPDLAADTLSRVLAPTLLIVGGCDPVVLQLNREARTRIPGETELLTIPAATHLFEEPGTLEQVAEATAAWFERHLEPR
jgi:putative phosphoribosyl transferase